MLKLTYTDTGVHLEHCPGSVEDWMATRVVLSVRAAEPLHMEPCSASLLVRSHLPGLDALQTAARTTATSQILFSASDAEFVEITLCGTWMTCQPNAPEGVFLSNLYPPLEALLFDLWQRSQVVLGMAN